MQKFFLALIAFVATASVTLADPPAPPAGPSCIEQAILDQLKQINCKLDGLSGDVGSLKTRVASLEDRVTRLESCPPKTVTEYRTVYKCTPPTYIYVPVERCYYTYCGGYRHYYCGTSCRWVRYY